MTAFVLDCSIAMSWWFEDEAHADTDVLLERLRDAGAMVPAIWHWEVANVLLSAARRGRLSAGDAASRLSLLATLPITTDSDATARVWRETLMLAQAEHLTVYDAAYMELAIRLGVDLATKDDDLRAAATRLGVRIVP